MDYVFMRYRELLPYPGCREQNALTKQRTDGPGAKLLKYKVSKKFVSGYSLFELMENQIGKDL